MKPLLQSERNKTSSDIILQEGEQNITDKLQMCNIFNAYFSSIAQNIGFNEVLPEIISRESVSNMVSKYGNHLSVQDIKINMNIKKIPEFKFNEISAQDISNTITSLCGYDHLAAKILKLGNKIISAQLTPIINHCIKKSTFPDDLKYAQITPIHKKSDEHDKKNYRPVSVLTSLSKVFEKCLNNQLQNHVEAIFEPLITAYRKGQVCQTLLLNMVSEW